MQDQVFSKMESPVEPLQNTWTFNQDTGSWVIVLPYNLQSLSTEEINLWYAASVTKTLKSFSNLIRAWQINFGSFNQDEGEIINLEWQQGICYEDYIENVLNIIKNYPTPIFEIGINVDLFVYVYISTSPKQPIQTWVRLPHNEFYIHGGLGHGEPYLHFDIAYTIFGPATKEISPLTGPYPEPEADFEVTLDDNQLQLLNQPLLEQALRKWEEYFGEITDVQGIPGIQKYGFLVETYEK